MKLICAIICVSLVLQLVQCARLIYLIDKAKNNGESETEAVPNRNVRQTEKDCCHLPQEKQNCSCCENACIENRQIILPKQYTCCHLPKLFLNCECCPTACQSLPLFLIRNPQLQLPQLLPHQLESPPPLIKLPKQPLLSNCCKLPKPFRNCQCCLSACYQPPQVPFNASCCHWPQYLQTCACCISSCTTASPTPVPTSEPTPVVSIPTTENKNSTENAALDDCCALIVKLQNCNCCAQACKKDSTTQTDPTESTLQTIPTTLITNKPKKPSDCCHLQKGLRNCKCCPRLCQQTTMIIYTEQPITPLPNREDTKNGKTTPKTVTGFNCCHLPNEFRTCKCCPEDCDASANLLQYENCCNWPKMLQRCSCCQNACQYVRYQAVEFNKQVEDCCNAPLEQQNCQCCPTSHYCKLAVPDEIAFRYWLREFRNRPETYFVRMPAKKKRFAVGLGNHRVSRIKSSCALNNNVISDDNVFRSEFPFQRIDAKKLMSQESDEQSKNHELAEKNPYVINSKNKIADKSLIDIISPTSLKEVGFRYGNIENKPTLSNEVPVNGLQMLTDLDSRNFDSNEINIVPLNEGEFISNTNNDLSTISSSITIPTLFANMIIADENTNLDSSTNDDETYVTNVSHDFFSSEPINNLEKRILRVNPNNNRYSDYHLLHLAAPFKEMKQLVTKIAIVCDTNVVDVQQSGNTIACRKLYIPIFSELFDYDYNSGTIDDDIDYLENEDYDIEERDTLSDRYENGNDYITLIEPVNFDLIIPLQHPFLPNAASKYYLPQTRNNSNQYESNNENIENLWKFYSAPPKSVYNSVILDKLAKIATGVIANHGEIEFEPNENYAEKFMPYLNPKGKPQIKGVNDKIGNIADAFINRLINNLSNQELSEIIPWLNMYGVGKLNNNRRSDSSYPNPAFAANPRRLSSVELIGIIEDDDDESDNKSFQGDRDFTNQNRLMPLPNSWIEDPMSEEQDILNVNTREVNSISHNSESQDFSNTESINKEGTNKQKRHIRSYKNSYPYNMNWFNNGRNLKMPISTIDNNRRNQFLTRDLVLENFFHTLRGLVTDKTQMKHIRVPFDNNYNRKNAITNALLRKFENDKNIKLNTQTSTPSNLWPIVYDVKDPKSLDKFVPVLFPKKNNKASGNARSSKLKIKTPKKEEPIPRLPFVVIFRKPSLPLDLQSFLSNYLLLNKDGSICREQPIISEAPLRLLYPEIIDGLRKVQNFDIPIDYSDDGKEKAIVENEMLYRTARVVPPVEEPDDNEEFGVEVKSLGAGDLYRTKMDEEKEKLSKVANENHVGERVTEDDNAGT